MSAVGWPPRCLVGRVFVRGIVLVCAPLDVHGWRGRVRVPLPRYGSLAQWMERPVTSREVVGSSPTRPTEHGRVPRCYRSLLVVAYVTVWARVVGLRASRWACYCVSIVPSRPPGLAGCIVSVAELADALDLGSSAFGRVGSSPTGRTGGGVSCIFSCRSRSPHVIVLVSVARRVSSIW